MRRQNNMKQTGKLNMNLYPPDHFITITAIGLLNTQFFALTSLVADVPIFIFHKAEYLDKEASYKYFTKKGILLI